MKVTTTGYIDESKYEILDVVHGVSIRSFSFFRQFLGGLRGIFGGKADEFEQKYIEAWEEAWDEMKEAAKKRGADAIYGTDVDVSEISMGRSDGMILIAASGTAVKLKNKSGGNKKVRLKYETLRAVRGGGKKNQKRKKVNKKDKKDKKVIKGLKRNNKRK
jgi:uncharacterized protein YbjQ (UPF0145 family)